MFDVVASSEATFVPKLKDLCNQNIGWFMDFKTFGNSLSPKKGWYSKDPHGVYLIWYKDDYCDVHNLFHMRALYVGKGPIGTRLNRHWRNKDFSDEMLVYTSAFGLLNRHSKYVEQLLLDTFNFPLNSSENPGTEKLCAYFAQAEVD
jgi:hypothetical protein